MSVAETENQLYAATVLDLFSQVVLDRPNATAVVQDHCELSFVQLNALANQFANAFRSGGVKPGDRVGISYRHAPEAIAAMLGAFKIGAAFVPLDPAYPHDRLARIVEDADLHVIATAQRDGHPLHRCEGRLAGINWVESNDVAFADLNDLFDEPGAGSQDAAYLMYTSGSTGQPKGVLVDHRALTTYCLADIEAYGLTVDDRTLQFSTLSFDISIEEIFPPLLIGGCVVVRPEERSATCDELYDLIERFKVSVVHLATAYWHQWTDLLDVTDKTAPESLRAVIVTGERVSMPHFRRWQSRSVGVRWFNAYGPTETCVSATVFSPPDEFDATQMPIGKPLPGYELAILDGDGQPIEQGEIGELYIGGAAVAQGYWGRPELSEAAFVTLDLPGIPAGRYYRTGDLVRWSDWECLSFHGRRDQQIKIDSHRIEPGEIESVLNGHPMAQAAMVSPISEEIQSALVAYVEVGSNPVTAGQLSRYAASRLPSYMVPRRWVLVENFPLTLGGKIDVSRLNQLDHYDRSVEECYELPETEMERQLARIWCEVLQLPSVGRNDQFFSLGGSSILASRVITELNRDFDIEVPVRDLFAHPGLKDAARHLSQLLAHQSGNTYTLESRAEGDRSGRASTAHETPEVTAGFLGEHDRRRFYVQYSPRIGDGGATHRRKHGVLICNPLDHEQTRAYSNLQQLGLQLASEGFDVLRFDYCGTGNSSGRYEEGRVESYQNDIRKAADFFRREAALEELAVLGVRAGGTLAATAQITPAPDQLIVWDPVVDGIRYLQLLNRMHQYALESQTRFTKRTASSRDNQLFGYQISPERQLSISNLRLPNQPACRNLLLTSREYSEHEPGFYGIQMAWNHVLTEDVIEWHDAKYTESAFASPAAFREVMNFLTEMDCRPGDAQDA